MNDRPYDQIVCYGDRFRLRYVQRKRGADPLYLIAAEKGGREHYPRMGSIDQSVLLMFAGQEGRFKTGDPVSTRATVQLVTTESVVGDSNTLGAFKGDHFLYYHPPGKPEQHWQLQVDSPSFHDGTLRAGDDIVFYNRESSERRMAQDQREPDYLTIDPASKGSWQIELVPREEPSPLT